MSPPLPRRHATEFIHGSRRQRALERSEPVGLMWIGHDRLLFSDSRARDASGPGRGYLHTAASRPLQLARRQAGLQVIRALLVPGTRPDSRRDCVRCLSRPDTRRLGSVEGRAGAGARPAALAARSTACCGHCCSSCGSPPPAPLQLAPLERRRRWSPASLRLAHKHWGSAGGSFNYTFTPCSALVGGSSRSRCAAAMLCRDAPLGQPSGTSSSAARGLTPWPPSRTRCDSDGDAGGNESLAAAAARRASAGGRASRVLLLAVRAPLRAAIVVTIAYADSGGKSSPAEVHGARQRRSPSSPPATAPSPP